jgi:hypothetical protein
MQAVEIASGAWRITLANTGGIASGTEGRWVPKDRRRAFGTHGNSASSLPGSTKEHGSCIIGAVRGSGPTSKADHRDRETKSRRRPMIRWDREVVVRDSEGRKQVTVSILRGTSHD